MFKKVGDCWIWSGLDNGRGYGILCLKGKVFMAHRISYEFHIGKIPKGLQLDHLCRKTKCVNPSHLEPVTCAENVLRGFGPPAMNARKKACKLGHPFSLENTYKRPDDPKERECRICRETSRQKWKKKKRSGENK